MLLVSLMAEDPYNNFLPSTGQISHFFHYSTIRNVFKTTLYTGARVTPMYDPFIGKILTYAVERPNAINDMRIFLDNIIIRGIRTNLVFLKHLLENADLRNGEHHHRFPAPEVRLQQAEEHRGAVADRRRPAGRRLPHRQPQEELQGQAGKDEAARILQAALQLLLR